MDSTTPVADGNAVQRILLRASEAAEQLGISEKTLWSLTHPRGPIPVVTVGTSGVRYRPESLRAWAAANESGTSEAAK